MVASRNISSGSRLTDRATSSSNAVDQSAASACLSKRARLMNAFEEDDCETDDLVSSVTQYLSSAEKPTIEERDNPLLYWWNSKYSKLA